MKKNVLFVGMLVIALVFGLLIAGCDTGTNSDSNPFVGMWIRDDITLTIRADSTWSIIRTPEDKDKFTPRKGTYTYSGNTATLALTHFWDFDKEDWAAEPVKGSLTATVSGNELTGREGNETAMYTKKQ
jgi:hypothetical protein